MKAVGVIMDDGSELRADTVISGCTPYHTFMELMPENNTSFNDNNGAGNGNGSGGVYVSTAKSGKRGSDRGSGGSGSPFPADFLKQIKHTGTIDIDAIHIHACTFIVIASCCLLLLMSFEEST
jgi:hypothetical protein